MSSLGNYTDTSYRTGGIVYPNSSQEGDNVREVYSDGSTFVGKIRDGIRIYGTRHFVNGDVYVGEFGQVTDGWYVEKYYPEYCDGPFGINLNTMYGEGTYTFKNGQEFTGTFDRGGWGKGTLTCVNGEVWSGTFGKDYHMNGEGVWINSESGVEYVGGFSESVPHGKGMLNFPSGAYFAGEYVRGLPWSGAFTNASGEVESVVVEGYSRFTN